MKYKIGDRVQHRLTNEDMIIIEIETGKMYVCRDKDYQKHTFEECEIRGIV